jgi:hemoglobin
LSVTDVSLYDRVGGEAFFTGLVDRFYAGVALDLLLRPMYPDDLGEAASHLALFLIQYWGGPRTYSDTRGHPRLRMRHAPFRVDEAARDAWLAHMRDALDAVELDVADRAELDAYFDMAAHQLRNT